MTTLETHTLDLLAATQRLDIEISLQVLRAEKKFLTASGRYSPQQKGEDQGAGVMPARLQPSLGVCACCGSPTQRVGLTGRLVCTDCAALCQANVDAAPTGKARW